MTPGNACYEYCAQETVRQSAGMVCCIHCGPWLQTLWQASPSLHLPHINLQINGQPSWDSSPLAQYCTGKVAGRTLCTLARWQGGHYAYWQAGREDTMHTGKVAGRTLCTLASWQGGHYAHWQAGREDTMHPYSGRKLKLLGLPPNWGLWCQEQISLAWISNYIPQ